MIAASDTNVSEYTVHRSLLHMCQGAQADTTMGRSAWELDHKTMEEGGLVWWSHSAG